MSSPRSTQRLFLLCRTSYQCREAKKTRLSPSLRRTNWSWTFRRLWKRRAVPKFLLQVNGKTWSSPQCTDIPSHQCSLLKMHGVNKSLLLLSAPADSRYLGPSLQSAVVYQAQQKAVLLMWHTDCRFTLRSKDRSSYCWQETHQIYVHIISVCEFFLEGDLTFVKISNKGL